MRFWSSASWRTAPFGEANGRSLDAIEREGHRFADRFPALEFGVIGALAHLAIRIGGQVADHGYGELFRPAVTLDRHLELAGDRSLELPHRPAARDKQFGGQIFQLRVHQVLALLDYFVENQSVLGQRRCLPADLIQDAPQRADPRLEADD
jgi:hypothetical protein